MLKYIVLALLALGWTTVNAQGYFDFDQVPGLAGGPKVQIDLNSVMLGFVREAARIADPDAATAIEGIEGVRVRVYEVEDDAGPLFDFIDDASQRLEAGGWQRMVYVQDEDARVRVYVSFIETRMSGLTVMVAGSDDEAVFINLLGEIDPAKLGRAAAALGVDQLIPNFGVEQTEPIGGPVFVWSKHRVISNCITAGLPFDLSLCIAVAMTTSLSREWWRESSLEVVKVRCRPFACRTANCHAVDLHGILTQ